MRSGESNGSDSAITTKPTLQASAGIEEAILRAVAYVDVFDYPLTACEIHRSLVRHSATLADVQLALRDRSLVGRHLSQVGSYYMLPGRESIVRTRDAREAVAGRLWPVALAYGRQLRRLPFVRMVAVTGSLAVNNVGRHVDIDYLIVTADDHLWVCRAFVIAVVRWARMRGIELCPNYFLTERALAFSDRNLYTAHEVVQMIPLYGREIYDELRRVNDWTADYLPNANGPPPPPAEAGAVAPARRGGLSAGRLLEAALDTQPGRWLDRWEMERKVAKFRRLSPTWQESDFSPNCCKGHFELHKQRAMEAFETRLDEQYGLTDLG